MWTAGLHQPPESWMLILAWLPKEISVGWWLYHHNKKPTGSCFWPQVSLVLPLFPSDLFSPSCLSSTWEFAALKTMSRQTAEHFKQFSLLKQHVLEMISKSSSKTVSDLDGTPYFGPISRWNVILARWSISLSFPKNGPTKPVSVNVCHSMVLRSRLLLLLAAGVGVGKLK